MQKIKFYIVDVFAEEKYAGNQLAVFRSGQLLDSDQMQCIAREMNFSETTFILDETKHAGGFDVRIFTPKAEVPFAGHPTLGTAHVIRTEILPELEERVILNLKVGPIPVSYTQEGQGSGNYWMQQNEPEFGCQFKAETLAPILNLDPAEFDERFPIQEVSTGLPFFIIPLKTLSSLKRARVAKEAYFEFIKDTFAQGLLVFCPESHAARNHISVRVFVDCFGIPEDPATGSGNGCLAGYLARYRYWGKPDIDIRAEQGYEIERPSLLFLRGSDQGDKINVSVGGKAIIVGSGEFY